jgi:Zinc ribbon domain.
MPLYTYKCQNEDCEHSEDKIVKLSNRDDERKCTKCEDGLMQREEFTAGDKGATFRYRGNWFNTTGRY